MQKLKVKLTGNGSMLMHNVRLSNPMEKIVQTIKTFSKKRNKTEDDVFHLARLEWEGGLYLSPAGEPILPEKMTYKSFLMGARKNRLGKQYESAVQIVGDSKLKYKGKTFKAKGGKFPDPSLDKAFEEHCFVTMVAVERKRIPRARPIFHDWSCEVRLIFNPELLDKISLIQAIKDAGEQCGVGDWRPQYGKFTVKVLKN